jgi:hypothetical protein
MALKVLCCAPVAASPEACVSPLRRFWPVALNSLLKPVVIEPPPSRPLSIAVATFLWLMLAKPGSDGDSRPASSVSSSLLPDWLSRALRA